MYVFLLFVFKAKVLLVSGSSKDMELVDLTTQQSETFPFPLKNAKGGQITAKEAYFCDFDQELKCVLLDLCTFETKYTAVTVTKQVRALGTIVNGQIALTGGRRPTQNTDLIQMVSLTHSVDSGARLPETLDTHCISHVNSTTLALIAGYTGSGNTAQTWFIHGIDGNENSWRTVPGPNLNIARRIHSCGTFEYQSEVYVIVLGGCRCPYTKTVEILNTKDTNWFYGNVFNILLFYVCIHKIQSF